MTELAAQPAGKRLDLAELGLRVARTQIVQRMVRALLVGFGVMVISFALLRFIPGDPVQLLLGDAATEELVAVYREALGLDGTPLEQFWRYTSGVARGDLGTSLQTRASVNDVIARTLPVTLWLILVTLVFAVAAALPLAIAAAVYRRTWFGHFFRIGSSVLLATPVFYSGLLLLLLFALRLEIAPVAGYETDFPENLSYLWLPALTLSGVMVPIVARVLQSSIVDTLEQEFVESAIVRGVSFLPFTWRYLLRPSLPPTVSLLGYMIGQLLSAAVVVEIVFNLPGIGTALIVEGVLLRDYTVVQGIVLVFGFIVVFVSLLSDVVSGWLDPRTKLT
jgi:ABC-type dipeptide/oligopeptide/nickel transport system permease component